LLFRERRVVRSFKAPACPDECRGSLTKGDKA